MMKTSTSYTFLVSELCWDKLQSAVSVDGSKASWGWLLAPCLLTGDPQWWWQCFWRSGPARFPKAQSRNLPQSLLHFWLSHPETPTGLSSLLINSHQCSDHNFLPSYSYLSSNNKHHSWFWSSFCGHEQFIILCLTGSKPVGRLHSPGTLGDA